MRLIIGVNPDGTQNSIDLKKIGKPKDIKPDKKRDLKGNIIGQNFMPLEDSDSSQIEKETDIAMAVRLLIHEIQEMKSLDKTAVLNSTQAHAITKFENVRNMQMMPSKIPLTDDIKRLSQSIKGIRSEQIKDMVIGKNKDSLAEKLLGEVTKK